MEGGAGGLGIGLDLVEVDRLERALERRPRLADRLFTEGERAYAEARPRPGRHLAARFCAKEAVAKALGAAAWSFRDVEVVATGGAPQVRLSGSLAELARELGVAPVVSLPQRRPTAAAAALRRRARPPAAPRGRAAGPSAGGGASSGGRAR